MSGPWPSSAPHDAVGCDRRHRLPLPRRSQLAGGVLAAAPRRRRGHQRGAGRPVRRRQRLRSRPRANRARCTRAGADSSRRSTSSTPPSSASRLARQAVSIPSTVCSSRSPTRRSRTRGCRPIGSPELAPASSSGTRRTTTARLQMYPVNRHLIDSHSMTGGASSIAANRISYMLDLRGPSFIVDTACSSALTAVHLACAQPRRRRVRRSRSPAASSCISRPSSTIGFCKAVDALARRPLPCRSTRAPTATSAAKAPALVLLKPLTPRSPTATAIYAVHPRHGGQPGRPHAGHHRAQPARAGGAAARRAGRRAGLEPSAVQYVEAHGTGTPVGDPIEAAALGAVLGVGGRRTSRCLIGSVKTQHRAPRGGRGRRRADQGRAGPAAPADPAAASTSSSRTPTSTSTRSRSGCHGRSSRGRPTARRRVAGVNSFGFGGDQRARRPEEAPAASRPATPSPAQARPVAPAALGPQP